MTHLLPNPCRTRQKRRYLRAGLDYAWKIRGPRSHFLSYISMINPDHSLAYSRALCMLSKCSLLVSKGARELRKSWRDEFRWAIVSGQMNVFFATETCYNRNQEPRKS